MWHWPQVSGIRASSTEAACRAWQAVQVPIEPSALGLPTSWHIEQPLVTAAGPSIATSGLGAPLDRAGMELLGESDLFGGELPGAAHRRPGGRGVAASQVLPILGGVALAAIGGGQGLGDGEPAMGQRLWPSTAWWQSRQVTPTCAWRLPSN